MSLEYLEFNGYLFIKKLGSGKFSDVWLTVKNSTHYAVKVLPYKRDKTDIKSEINFLSYYTRSACVINMIEHFKIYLDNDLESHEKEIYCCIVLEYMGKELYWLITDYSKYGYIIPRTVITKITKQITKGLIELHNNTIIHTDLKPENILLPSLDKYPSFYLSERTYITKFKKITGVAMSKTHLQILFQLHRELILLNEIDNIKISDLGLSCYDSRYKTYSIVTRHYRPPEIILKHPYTTTVDLWSLGCIIYELIACNILFFPTKNNNMSQNSHHLALMIKTFGDIPKHIVKKSKRGRKYFDTKNERCTYLFQYLIGRRESLSHIFYKYWNISKKNALYYERLLKPLFIYDPQKRITAEDYLEFLETNSI